MRRYVTICKDEFQKHDIVEKTVNIRNKLANGVTDKLMKKLNQIDQLRKHIVLKAKRKCCKLKTGQVPFTPDNVQLYGRQIRLWSLVIAKKAKRKVSTQLILRLAKKLGLQDYMSLTIKAIKKLRATAWKKTIDHSNQQQRNANNDSLRNVLKKKKRKAT